MLQEDAQKIEPTILEEDVETSLGSPPHQHATTSMNNNNSLHKNFEVNDVFPLIAEPSSPTSLLLDSRRSSRVTLPPEDERLMKELVSFKKFKDTLFF